MSKSRQLKTLNGYNIYNIFCVTLINFKGLPNDLKWILLKNFITFK